MRFTTIYSTTLAKSIRDIVLCLNSANTLVVLLSIIVIHDESLDTPPEGSTPIIGGYFGINELVRGISSKSLNSYLPNINIVLIGSLVNFLITSSSSLVNGQFSDSLLHSNKNSLRIVGQSHSCFFKLCYYRLTVTICL